MSNRVANFVGAKKLVDYASSKIAKRRAAPSARKFVEDKTTGRQAALSAANTAATIGTGGAGVLRALGKKAVTRAVSKKITPKVVPKQKLKIVKGYKSKRGNNASGPKTWSEGGW